MKLVIAEKPSVAQSLAAVIGATARKDGYLEGNGWRVSWCVGHLAGLADADAYNPDYAKWRYDDLPILPDHWQMVVGKDKKKQFDVLKQLMNAPDVTEVVNACDAGREGELIFRSVYEAGRLPEANEAALDFLDGGFRHPGRLCEPAPRREL